MKNKISHPPPLADKNMKNRLREKLSDYNPPTISSRPPADMPKEHENNHSMIIKPSQRSAVILREQANGIGVNLQGGTVNGGNGTDSE